MRVDVLYFAAARERAGIDRESFDLELGTVQALAEAVTARHPNLAPLLPRLRFAVNRTFVRGNAVVGDGDEVALIPPVAGGSGRYAIGEEKLDLADLIGRVVGPEHGAVVTFTGTVRGESHGKKVRRLEYEAYGAMALEQIEAIGTDLERKWPGVRLAIHHRYGTLEVGEAAVLIAAAAPHRADAFRACEEAIDRLKRDAPIWKKEVFEDGAEWVGLGP